MTERFRVGGEASGVGAMRLPAFVLGVLVVAACEPPPPADERATDAQSTAEAEANVDATGVEPQPDDNVFHLGEAIPWGEASEVMRYAALYGSSGAEGRAFVFRLDVRPGFELGPHTHPITEHMTVLSGTFMVGIGESFDRDAASAYGPGSYLAIQAGVPAYMWVEEPTVVQVHGVGPLTTQFLEPEG